jgi:hypothetical protein
MSIYKRTLEETLRNKQLRLEGKHIAIPFPFPRFSEYFPGIMKRRYFITTANSKVGKSKITDFLFVINPFMFAKYSETNIKPRIKYFTLEMSKEDKIKEVRSFLLFYLHGITMSPDYVDSIYTGKILDNTTERIIKSDEFLQWFEDFESVVEYIDFTKNPYGIYKHVREYAHKTGVYYDKQNKPMDMSIVLHADDRDFKMTPDYKIQLEEFNKNIGYYKPNDEDVYNIIVVDHARLLTLEKDYDDRKNIENFSSSYLMPMRDRWDFIPVMVQQQAASQESVENMKANRLRPTPDGLGISKNTQQDADTLIGLFAPSRHNILNWERYDVSRLGDSHRELSILLNRRGNSVTTQLYFNGAANFFKELPKVSEMADVVYSKIQKHDVNTKELWT